MSTIISTLTPVDIHQLMIEFKANHHLRFLEPLATADNRPLDHGDSFPISTMCARHEWRPSKHGARLLLLQPLPAYTIHIPWETETV